MFGYGVQGALHKWRELSPVEGRNGARRRFTLLNCRSLKLSIHCLSMKVNFIHVLFFKFLINLLEKNWKGCHRFC